MPAIEYIKWPSNASIPLTMTLVNSFGAGVSGAAPEVSIRRYRETYGHSLDLWYWNGAAFTMTPTWLLMPEPDPVNLPGVYSYLFNQPVVGLEWTYLVYYRNLITPIMFAVELHVVTNEIYIPYTQPDPIVVGPDSVMGQLELVKGLLHHNAIVDNQTFAEGLLTSARVRMFDVPANVPPNPGGNETVGLLMEFHVAATYDADGLNRKFTLKRTFP